MGWDDRGIDMHGHQGLFIVLEGADGSGKTTQFSLLERRLRNAGYEIEVFDFPRYEHSSSHFVRSYLNGEYGPASSINPYTASLFFALDRFEAAPDIRAALEKGKIVLSNRYVGSNMAHQGAKFDDEGQQRGFFLWEDGLEYQLLGIPRPSLNIYLRVPADISYKLIGGKNERSYTKNTHDEHEADIEHLKKSVQTYDTLTELFPKDFVAVECVVKGELLSIDEVSKLIWKKVEPLLPASPKSKRQTKTTTIDEPSPSKKPATDNLSEASNPPRELSIKLKNVSLLAALALESQPLEVIAESLKQGFDYHLPENISDESVGIYTDAMEKLKINYKNLHDSLVRHGKKHPARTNSDIKAAMLPILPLSAYTTISIKANPDRLGQLVAGLNTSPLPEIRYLADKIIDIAASQGVKLSADSKGGNQDDPESVATTITKLAKSRLPRQLTTAAEEFRLLHASPRNEFELIFEGSLHGSEDRSYEQKQRALKSLLENADENALQQVSYVFEALLDRVEILSLMNSGFIEDLSLQIPTPRYGYETPGLIEDAGLEDIYSDSFEESFRLFSHLLATGREEYGGYAMLLGHKLGCEFTVHASSLLRAIARDENILEILLRLREKISEIHPLIAEHLQIRLGRQKPTEAKKTAQRHRRKTSKRSKKS